MSYVYIKTESELFTVGFYDPAGKFQPESDHGTDIEAAERVHWLNGGHDIIVTPPLAEGVPYIVTLVHDEFTVQRLADSELATEMKRLQSSEQEAHKALDAYGIARGAFGHSVRYRIGLLVESLGDRS